jgi:hypothetical protein
MEPALVVETRGYFTQRLDWGYTIEQAQRHSVLPLVSQNLRAHFAGLVPESEAAFFDEASRICQRRNLALTRELLRMLALFAEHGIEAIPFKGPVLALSVYGNIALRMFADLDILIREEHLTKACAVLLADGYAAEFTLTPGQERGYRKTECALQLRHEGRQSVVELHWLLTERYLSIDFPLEAIRQRSPVATIWQRQIKTLAPEDLVLYLCVHGGKHQWERLEWLCCFTEAVLAHPEIDWAAIFKHAHIWGIERMLRTALLLGHRLLELPLPEEVRLYTGGDPAAARLAAQAAQRMLVGTPHSADDPTPRSDWYFYLLRMRERWQDKLRILAYSAMRQPHPYARELVTLPPVLAFLYYALRPARLAGSVMREAYRHIAARRKGGENTVPICSA